MDTEELAPISVATHKETQHSGSIFSSCAALRRLEFGSLNVPKYARPLGWPTALDVTSEAVLEAIALVKFATERIDFAIALK